MFVKLSSFFTCLNGAYSINAYCPNIITEKQLGQRDLNSEVTILDGLISYPLLIGNNLGLIKVNLNNEVAALMR